LKKILLATVLTLSLLASAIDKERNIYRAILNAIFPEKKVIYVWLDNPKRKDVFKKISRVEIVDNRDKADILILYNTFDVPDDNKIIFADGYLVFEHFKDRLVGGFYWQKGRPNLVFLKKNLKDHNITLPESLKDYIEDDM